MTRRDILIAIVAFFLVLGIRALLSITHYTNVVCTWPADGDERANRGEAVEYNCEDKTPWYKR